MQIITRTGMMIIRGLIIFVTQTWILIGSLTPLAGALTKLSMAWRNVVIAYTRIHTHTLVLELSTHTLRLQPLWVTIKYSSDDCYHGPVILNQQNLNYVFVASFHWLYRLSQNRITSSKSGVFLACNVRGCWLKVDDANHCLVE